MEIKPGKFVAVSYKLCGIQNNQPEVELEETRQDEPFKFIFGTGFMLEAFEEKIKGMNQGEKFDFVIDCEKAFGEIDENMLFPLAKDIFKNAEGEFDSESVVEGAILPMRSQEGQVVNGQVMQITDSEVIMNFNHPFAGMDLHFIGSIEEVREATEADIHEMNGGCGGGCGSCDCGDDHEGGCCGGHDHEHGHEGCGCGGH